MSGFGRGAFERGARRAARVAAGLAGMWLVLAAAHPAAAGPGDDAQSDPSRPEDVVAVGVSSSQIDVSWSPVTDGFFLQLYRIYRDGDEVGTTPANVTTFSDTGLQPFTEYEYRVTAEDIIGESNKSHRATATTLDGSPPSAPTGLQGSAQSSTTIDLNWSAASDSETGIAGYIVYRNGLSVGTPTSTSFSDTGLTPFTSFTYRVSAVNGDGLEGPQSESVVIMTPDGTEPSAPTGLQGSAQNSTTIELDWSAAQDPESGISGYVVYRNGSSVGTPTSTSFSDTGLQSFTEYEYRVSAVNGAGQEGNKSSEIAVRTADETKPTKPGNLTGTAVGPTQIDLTWSASQDPESGISGYVVFRDGSSVGTPTSTSFSDTGLQSFTEYEYRVAAVNGAGERGNKSSEIEVTTLDGTPPTAPSGVSAEATSPSTADISWQAASDPESGVVEYTVYRDGAPVGTSVTTTFAAAGLTPETSYVFEISATNGDGVEGPLSGPAEVTTPAASDITPPSVPQSLAASGITDTQITLTWSASTDPESGVSEYRLYRDDVLVGTDGGTTITDTGLSPNTSYEYRVSAVNGDGVESAQSSPVKASTLAQPDTVAPAPPTNLRITS